VLIVADARRLPLRDRSVQAVVTSPPYWGLRDYGPANQIGLEATPDAYVASLRAVFAEVWRVLKDDGTLWLNLGDCHTASGCGGDTGHSGLQGSIASQEASKRAGQRRGVRSSFHRDRGPREDAAHKSVPGLKSKNLVGIPWRVAFALQADGWYLRSDIIWHKPNPMPESVTDRPTSAHDYLFLLAKSERYYYDAAAIKEPVTGGSHRRGAGVNPKAGKNERSGDRRKDGFNERWREKQNASFSGAINELVDERNKRDVWTISTQAYAGDHSATFPEALVQPCILAGCPLGGLVLDPFLGTGTVGAVSERLGRRWVGTDLTYQPLAKERTAQRGIRW
jgi:site-specific DNA-methyltransferase (cytosine-N4-specific)